VQRTSWGREWVDFHDATGRLSAIPIDWTDRAAPDPFVVVAAGRCHLRFDDLLRLVDMVEHVCKAKDAAYDRRNMPPRLPSDSVPLDAIRQGPGPVRDA
jgi:hypothetical protein